MGSTYMTSGDYDERLAIASAHWEREEQESYESAMGFWQDSVTQVEPGDEPELIRALQHERKKTRCNGSHRAYDELIEQLKNR